MTGTKQILLAGFVALCMVLPACRSTSEPETVEAPPLVVAHPPLASASYTAEYSQEGSSPFVCEVKLGTDGRIRRDYVWKDEKDAEKKVTVMVNGGKAVRIEDGKVEDIMDSDAAKERFFAGLVLGRDTIVSARTKTGAGKASGDADGVLPCIVYEVELEDVPGVESCVVKTDPKSNQWSILEVRMAADPGDVVSTSFRDYRSESGVTYPSRIVSETENGAPVTCTIRDVKINPELPDELFRLPDPNG